MFVSDEKRIVGFCVAERISKVRIFIFALVQMFQKVSCEWSVLTLSDTNCRTHTKGKRKESYSNVPQPMLTSERCLVWSRIWNSTFQGYRILTDEKSWTNCNDSTQPLCCTTDSEPAKCGINRIWVLQSARRQGVARKLLDCIRCACASFSKSRVMRKVVYRCARRSSSAFSWLRAIENLVQRQRLSFGRANMYIPLGQLDPPPLLSFPSLITCPNNAMGCGALHRFSGRDKMFLGSV